MKKIIIMAMSLVSSLPLAWGGVVGIHKVVSKEGVNTIKVTYEGGELILDKHAAITELDIVKASLNPERKSVICITLDAQGAKKLSVLTKQLAATKGRLAVLVEGKVVNAPVVQSELTKRFEISGYREAEEESMKALIDRINTAMKDKKKS